eukprot:5850019-Alexandrium_andersonii.AAC.1
MAARPSSPWALRKPLARAAAAAPRLWHLRQLLALQRPRLPPSELGRCCRRLARSSVRSSAASWPVASSAPRA